MGVDGTHKILSVCRPIWSLLMLLELTLYDVAWSSLAPTRIRWRCCFSPHLLSTWQCVCAVYNVLSFYAAWWHNNKHTTLSDSRSFMSHTERQLSAWQAWSYTSWVNEWVKLGVAKIFSGCTFFLTKNLMTYFHLSPSLTWSYTSYTATNYFFIASAGVRLTKFSPSFASFQQKCLENFFRRPGVGARPGYAYGS